MRVRRSAATPTLTQQPRALGPFLIMVLCGLALVLPQAFADEGEGSTPLTYPNNVALHVVPREILFFSAPAGTWSSIKLDPGERIIRRGADGNVATVVTSLRAIGFSAILNVIDEIRLPEEETLEAFKVGGNLATVLTRRRALGFSALLGKWTTIERFMLGR